LPEAAGQPSAGEVARIARLISGRAAGAERFTVAVAGPPGAGKSTFAEALRARLAEAGEAVAVVPMDGFHYDNAVLEARGLLARKGAPETFDAEGFRHLLERLREPGRAVAIPVFDRSIDIARAGARIVEATTRILIVEGNYLLLDEAPWRRMAALFDLRIFLETSMAELERRLVQRWIDHGHSAEAARQRALANDIPNAGRVMAARLGADEIVRF
jgi:pantothenate kinase